MAAREHLDILDKGVNSWNRWREQNPHINPDLSGAALRGKTLVRINLARANLNRADLSAANLTMSDLSGAQLSRADLCATNLDEARLCGAYLGRADLSGAHLCKCDLSSATVIRAFLSAADLNGSNLAGADLSRTVLSTARLKETNLRKANLTRSDLSWADLTGADLTDAKLNAAVFVKTVLYRATLNKCNIHAASMWDVKVDKTTSQSGLCINAEGEPGIIVDNLETALFVSLLVKNRTAQNLITGMTRTAVLILGKLEEKKETINLIAAGLRKRGESVIAMDFGRGNMEKSAERLAALARLCKYGIADIDIEQSSSRRLHLLLKNIGIPVIPLIETLEKPMPLSDELAKNPLLLPRIFYPDIVYLGDKLERQVLMPVKERYESLQWQPAETAPV